MAKRELDKTKKSNMKCEHCWFWNKKDYHCKNMISENYNQKKIIGIDVNGLNGRINNGRDRVSS